MSHASMEEEERRLKHYYHDVKSFPLHIKPKNILHWAEGPLNFLLSKRFLSMPTSVGDEKSSVEPWTILHVASILISAFLFLLQYLKTYGEQLLKISQWIKMKSLLREVLLTALIFLFPLLLLFLPYLLTCSCTCNLTRCEWKQHLHTWWQWLSTNELNNPPRLQTIFEWS